MQSKLADCMADRGHIYDYPQYVNYWDGLTLSESHGAASLLDPMSEYFGIAEQHSSPAVRYFAVNGFDGTEEMRSWAFEDALDQCGSAGDDAHVSIPPRVRALGVELDVFVRTATNELGTTWASTARASPGAASTSRAPGTCRSG